jgi:hypothetical protein
MDLAVKDIRRHLGKFVATIVGVALLLTIVLVMNGIYQGNIADGVWLIDNTDADLWVVERGRGGPFNEYSRIPADAYRSVAATPGVARASPFITYAAQREIGGASQQFTIIGYDVFEGLGGPGRIVAGRTIRAAHYEMVADAKLGLALGDTVRLATHDYTVVGITRAAVDSGGNPLVYLALRTPAGAISRTIARSRSRAANPAPRARRLQPGAGGKAVAASRRLDRPGQRRAREARAGREPRSGARADPRLAVLQRVHHRRAARADARGAAAPHVGGPRPLPQPARARLDRDHRADRVRAHDREDPLDRHAEADRCAG